MRKLTEKLLLAGGLMLLSLSSAWAYSPSGPIGNAGDSYQVPVIGYGLAGDLVAPKNIGEEYRRNLPVMYYAYDANFFGFYGLAGSTNVDAAFGIMNGVLCGQTNSILFFNSPTNGVLLTNNESRGYSGVPFTLAPNNNLDSYDPSLPDFGPQAISYNPTAGAAGLVDLKSVALGALVEQMGLADPIRYAWTLHNRYQPPNTTCPNFTEYLVVRRNFDWMTTPLNQLQYSPYINDTLYTYTIFEHCSGANPLAVTIPLNVDPFANLNTPVAALNTDIFGYFTFLISGTNFMYQYQTVGGFYNNLTRDDVAGLRYLLSSNNVNFEATSANGSQLLTTNVQPPQTFGPTLPISLLFSTARTNDPNTLQTNFPGITYLSVTTNIINQVTTNRSAYFTNLPPPYTNTLPFSNNATIYPTNGRVPFTNWSPIQYGPIQLLNTLPLQTLVAQAQTLDPATLQALYPGLLFGEVFTNFFFVQVVTNVDTYFTNLPGPYTNRVATSNGVAIYATNGIVPFNWSPIQYGAAFPLTTLPLGPLLEQAKFLDPAALQALYPGLLIDNILTNYLVVQVITNITPFYTNQSVPPVFTNNNKPSLTNGYYFTNQPGPTIINYDLNSFEVIKTLNLANFSDQALTNGPAALLALYPGLVILQAHQFPAFVAVTNYISYLTNYTGAPYQGPPMAVTKPIATNYLFITNWSYIFGNVVTNHYYTNRTMTLQSIWTTNQIGAPYGSPFITNITTKIYSTNKISGDFFIIPTNWCGFQIIAVLPPNNPPYAFGLTNTIVFNGYNTNGSTGTNTPTANTYSLTQRYYDVYTNYSYAVRPGICEPVLAFATNTTTNVVNTYSYSFLNVVTNHIYTNTLFCVATTNVSSIPLGSPDLLVTNSSTNCFYTNLPSGDFYIVPTNWCGFQIISLLTNLNATTNVIVSSNSVGAGNGSQYTQYVISYYTNYTYSIRPGFCVAAVNSSQTTTTNIVTGYQYDFVNLVTNHIYFSNYVSTVTTNLALVTNGLLGSLTNIVRTNNFYTNIITGDFYIVPTNWCGFQIIGLLTNNNITTNTLTATNLPGVPNQGQQYTVTTYTAYTNYTYSIRPGVCEPAVAFGTNYTTNTITQYDYYFGNIVTNHFFTNGPVTVVTTNFAAVTNGLVGTITNIITTNVLNIGVGGDFYIVPPNFCVFNILGVLSSNIVFTTNTLVATNAPGTTALPGQVYSETTVTTYTNSTFLVQASTCDFTTPVSALRQGVQRVQFIRANYDSLIGQFFNPITNYYSMVKVTNSQPVKEFYRRVLVRPDVLLSAEDLLAGPSGLPVNFFFTRNINFDQSNILPNLAGPGVINPSTTISFNKSGRANLNVGTLFLAETNAAVLWNWASFDGTTNDPVVYPNGTSLANLENQIFIQVSPATVPDGTRNVAYPPLVFTVTGGQGPFVWAAPNLSALVPGMSFNASTQTLSGTPTAAGNFNFTVQVTDAVNRLVSLNYTIIIH